MKSVQKMETRAILMLLLVFSMLESVLAQGSLTPPGAPAPTMKTLDQVEPRIPVSSAPISLTTPGSYYLTTNLTGTVTIESDNVSLDLMGFTINSTSGNAIRFSGSKKNIRIHNGILSAPQQNGIFFDTSEADANGIIEDLRISDCRYYGIMVGSGFLIRNVHVEKCAGVGISADGNSRIQDCSVTANNVGLQVGTNKGALIENNRVWGNTDNYFLVAGNQLNILLCEVPETLDWPCSVKFAGTLVCTNNGVNGITVNADDVSIDLAGHALIGPGASSGYGIYQTDTFHNLTVKNGKVQGWRGTEKGGVYAEGKASRIHGIQASTNYYGIFVGYTSTISDCAAFNNDNNGIVASSGSTIGGCTANNNSNDGIFVGRGSTIGSCTANNNSNDGIYADTGGTISGCAVFNNSNNGINANSGNTISDCAASWNGNDGIHINYGSTVSACSAESNGDDGIEVDGYSIVSGNTCDTNGQGNNNGAGIHVTSTETRVDGNNVTDNDQGIKLDVGGNFIVRNTAAGNTTDYDIAGGNAVGTIQTTPVGAGAWDNFSF